MVVELKFNFDVIFSCLYQIGYIGIDAMRWVVGIKLVAEMITVKWVLLFVEVRGENEAKSLNNLVLTGGDIRWRSDFGYSGYNGSNLN